MAKRKNRAKGKGNQLWYATPLLGGLVSKRSHPSRIQPFDPTQEKKEEGSMSTDPEVLDRACRKAVIDATGPITPYEMAHLLSGSDGWHQNCFASFVQEVRANYRNLLRIKNIRGAI